MPHPSQPLIAQGRIRLKNFNPDFHNGFEKEETREKTIALCQRIGELQERLNASSRQALLLVFQGMDASGKDGATRRVLEFVDPSGVQATSFKAPTPEELAHDYLWRIHQAVPRRGQIGVFNRSHYEDVLVVRVMNLQPKPVWRRRFDEINAFEKHLTANGVVLLKFFLHISREEQRERLVARLDDPAKQWKFEKGDLDMRDRWDDFQEAYEEVLTRCSPPTARWHIVPADRKWYRDFVVASVVCSTLENLPMPWPKPHSNLGALRQRLKK